MRASSIGLHLFNDEEKFEVPIYEYDCSGCGDEHEVIQKMGAGTLRKCPSCGALRLRRKISRSAFHLKGDGWYVTDYASNGKSKETDSETAVSDSKSESKSTEKKETTATNGAASKQDSKKNPEPVAAG